MREPACRGQVSLSLVEAGIGVLLVLAVTAGFAVGPPPADTGRAQLDRYAHDTATVLRVPAGDGEPPGIDRAVASRERFEEARPAVRDRLDTLLPANVMYRVETPRGTIGHPVPADVTTGRASIPTAHGSVTVEVWYV